MKSNHKILEIELEEKWAKLANKMVGLICGWIFLRNSSKYQCFFFLLDHRLNEEPSILTSEEQTLVLLLRKLPSSILILKKVLSKEHLVATWHRPNTKDIPIGTPSPPGGEPSMLSIPYTWSYVWPNLSSKLSDSEGNVSSRCEVIKVGKNDPLLSLSISLNLYRYSDASTDGEVVGPSHDLLNISCSASCPTRGGDPCWPSIVLDVLLLWGVRTP